MDDLIGLPLFCSGQGWEKDIPLWAKDKMDKLHLEGSFRLAYNASVFAREHLGYLLTFDALSMQFRKIKLPPRGSGCAVCSDHPTITKLIDYEQAACELKK